MQRRVMCSHSPHPLLASHSFPCPYSTTFQSLPFIYAGRYIDEMNGFLYIYGYVSLITTTLPVVKLFPVHSNECKNLHSLLKEQIFHLKNENLKGMPPLDVLDSGRKSMVKKLFSKEVPRNYKSRIQLMKDKDVKWNVEGISTIHLKSLNFRKQLKACSKLSSEITN